VSDFPGSFNLDDIAPMRLVLQDAGAGTLGCISAGFVVHHGISFPTPAAYPLRIHINEAVIGTDEPDPPVAAGFVECDDLLDFFLSPEIDLADAAQQDSVVKARLALGFGSLPMAIAEVSRRDVAATTLSVAFTGRLTLRGDPRSLHDWISPLTRAIGFFSFCLDRPLRFEWIGGGDDDQVTLYAGWRVPAAPIDTVPIVRMGSVSSAQLEFAAHSWAKLWTQAPPLMDHILAFQLRRNILTIDDRLMFLARTLELYHGYAARFSSTIRSHAADEQLRETILANLPASIKGEESWLGDAIRESNRKRLSLQLEEILTDLGPEVVSACGIVAQPASFAKSVVKARNFFTHPKKKIPKGIPQGRELVAMIHRLWFVARACVLLELGLPREFIASALTQAAQRHYIVNDLS
jgi:ApeA N-terminal domain 1